MGTTLDSTLRRARGHAKRGEAAEAARLYAEVLAKFPKNRRARKALSALGGGSLSRALYDAGVAHHHAGRAAHALDNYVRALTLDPGLAEAHGNIGALHLAADNPEAALPACERAVALNPAFAEGWNNLGIARRRSGNPEGALAAFAKAAELNPESPEALGNLGTALAHANRPDMARKCLRAALALRPDHADALKNLAPLVRGEEAAALLAHAGKVAAAAAPESPQRMLAHYAVATLARKLGDCDTSLRALAEASRLGKAQSGYDPAADTALFAAIRAAFEDRSDPAPPDADPLPSVPVFILGMPRSGTSLAEQILASHGAVHATGERALLARLIARAGGPEAAAEPSGLARLRAGYRAALAEDARPGCRFVTDKMPLNFRWIGHIRRALPEARIVHMVRQPEAVLWSCYRLHFPAPGMAFSFDQTDLARYHRHYLGLMSFWRARYPEAVHDLCYEALTAAPEAEIRRLADVLGLRFDPAMLAPHETARIVDTASTAQIRRPIYQGSSDDWRRFAHGLGPMLEILGEGT